MEYFKSLNLYKQLIGTIICCSGLALGAVIAEEVQPEDSSLWDKTKESSADTWDKTKEISSDAWDATKEGSSDAWDATKEAVTPAEK